MANTSVIALGTVIIIVIVAALFFGVSLLGTGTHSTTTSQTGTLTTCSAGGCVLKLPIRFTFMNLYTNQPIIDSITATIYKGTLTVDSITTTGGVWNSTKADFQSGDSYSVYVVSGNSKFEFNFQIPLAQSQTQPRYVIPLKMALIGIYTIGVLAPDGITQINPTTGNYNVTASGNKHPTFTVTITNSADNTGLTGQFNRVEVVENNAPRKLVANALVVTSSGKVHVLGQTGTTYVQTLPDHATDRQRNPDGTFNLQGKYSTTVTFDTTGMAPGTTETLTINYYAYLDTWYYSNGGVINSEAVNLATFTFTISS